ncbi:MAG: ABC transporter permease subunit [Treponema sp.]|jgi:ABC-2 type transport system permease protein|nr:ABC transporter permease subunit [Treponema sp.]
MKAIIRRELSAYFTSPIGFVYLGAVYFLSGFFLLTGPLLANSADIRLVFSALLLAVMFLTPVLTMRLMTEDRRYRTDQALLTAPVSLGSIVAGKFLAAAIVYAAGISVTLAHALTLSFFAPMNWPIVWGNYIALLLLGFSFISIGQFISSLTENQAIAAIGAFAVMLVILLLDAIPAIIPNLRLAAIIGELSFIKRYTPISNGILSLSNLFFFISVCGIFLFLTARVLEKRRWS